MNLILTKDSTLFSFIVYVCVANSGSEFSNSHNLIPCKKKRKVCLPIFVQN